MGNQPNSSGLVAGAQSTAWEMALKRVADAKAAMDEFYDREVRPVNNAYTEGSATLDQVSAAEDAAHVYVVVHHDALRDLVATKAPTLADLAYKIEAAHADSVFDGGYADEAVKALLADIRGLI